MFSKKNIPKICNFVSAILAAAFVIKCLDDYTHYSNIINSAPFYVWVLANALYLIIPAIVVLVIGIAVKKKQEKFDL